MRSLWGRRRSPRSVAAWGPGPGAGGAARLRQLRAARLRLRRYSCYYLTRNSLTFTAPVLVADHSLGLDITSIGLVTSIFPLCYGMSKFVSGTLSDVLSPRVMLGGGLLMTGLMNCLFGASSSLQLFCLFWAANGVLQGFGAPSCAKILTAWFATKERGTYWGMWNIAHNLGGFSAPILAGNAARAFGWRVRTRRKRAETKLKHPATPRERFVELSTVSWTPRRLCPSQFQDT